jgi:hypothetical protein
MATNNTCILFMTHRLNSFILKEFDKLKECRLHGYDVKLFYDNSKNDFPFKRFRDEQEYALFTMADMEKAYSMVPFWKGKRNPFYGNLLFPILSFAAKRLYDFIWRIEFDVRFSGRWLDFFDEFASSPADLLGTTLGTFERTPSWNLWQTAALHGEPVPTAQLIRGFYPVLRLSRHACTVLEDAMRQGWQGHFEVILASILNQRHCLIEDIGGDGAFVSPAHKGRFYSNTPQNNNLYPGTFVWRIPEICSPHVLEKPAHLYHPVKYQTPAQRLYCLVKRWPQWLSHPLITSIKRLSRYRTTWRLFS